MKETYLDNHSNTRLDERVYKEILPYLDEIYANAQSSHSLGLKSKEAIEKAREQAAGLIGAQASEIHFTSNASEANNLAIKGIAEAQKHKGKHIIVSGIEHFSVLNSAKRLGLSGFKITHIPVDKHGLISPEHVKKEIKEDTILISIQHGNPEIGTVQPIEEISKIAKDKKILFHVDAVCTVGLVPVNAADLGVDLMTFSSSQMYGPKGTAALYVKKGVRIIPLIDGGIQEHGRRAGTENVPSIVGFGKACEIAKAEMNDNLKKITGLRDKLITELPKKIEHIYLTGHPQKRLPNNVSFLVEFVEGESMFLFLDQKGIYITSGSSCASKSLKLSHVLSATQADTALGQGSLLMTLSKYNNEEDIERIITELPMIVKKLRDMSPLYAYFLKTGQRRVAGPGADYDHDHEHEHEDKELFN
ncbi:cysteine desulfurase family protein [Elusimicrobiota bacterium]